jgi:hypothetical protein
MRGVTAGIRIDAKMELAGEEEDCQHEDKD